MTIPNWVASASPALDLPSWLRELDVGTHRVSSHSIEASELECEHLTEATHQGFVEVLARLPGPPCRMWAFLPRPTDRDSGSLSRYMRFNAGRASAFRQSGAAMPFIPASTCVGHAGSRLVLHALWIDGPCTVLENPRQRPAWRYSNRHGPVPPTFTRAVRTSGMLIASGTASVVGEDSSHTASLALQFAESVRNLDSLAEAGEAIGPWRSLQMYVRDADMLDRVRELARVTFGSSIERVLHASVCRRELLVEIEGVCDVA